MSEPAAPRPSPGEPLIRAVGLGKIFPSAGENVEALRAVSVSLAAGEFLAVEGASGSGKSTLLSLLAGLDRPTAGEVWFRGRRIDDLPEPALARFRRENVGFVFQSFHLVPSLTVLENILLPRAFARRAFARGAFATEDAGRLLELVGLSHRADFFPDKLSGGEKQRVAVARALVNDPPLLFADEPTGNLDSVNGGRVMDLLMAHVRGAGRALVLVTHDPALAARADRRLRLTDGRVDA